MKKNYALVLIALLCAVLSGYGQTPWINEIHYDNSGLDVDEGVEIAVPAGYSCAGVLEVILYNGNNGSIYNFSETVPSTGGTTSNGITFYWIPIAGLQNGAPDGLALVCDGTLIQFLSYEGSFTGTDGPANGIASINIGVSEADSSTVGFSLQLEGTGCDYADFTWTGSSSSTQNLINSLQTINCSVADPNLAITGTSDHNSSCISIAATPTQYTITNSGVLQANDINITSDNPQFVVSGLSSTTIAPSGNATYNVTFTPTAVGTQNATLTVTSSTTTSNSPTIDLTGLGITTPTITTQPTNQNEVIPNTATFTISATNATSYQWQVSTNGGGSWANVTGGTGATTDSYTTGATSAPMNTNQYQCVVTNSCGSVNSNDALLTLSNNSPSNAQSLSGCFEDTSVILSWNNPATPPTGGYLIFAIEGNTDPTAPTNDANTYAANSNFTAAPFETPVTLGKVVYKGNGTSATITGLTEDITYSFRIFAYNGEALTEYSNGTSGGSNLEQTAQGDVSNLVATPLTNQVNLNWNNPLPTSCFDQLIIVANEGPVVFTPTGTYANTDVNYTTPNTIMYSTTSTVSAKALSGLANGTNYCFKVFIRRGATWSDGVEVCAVPSLTYCSAGGNTSFDTGITGVNFNTIDNTGTSANNAYTNYTSISTDVTLGNNYNLGVVINIDGPVNVYTRAWIDWNQNGSFNDSGEQYELGMDTNPSASIDLNTATANSPINIEVPTNAALGVTRMRVFTQYNSLPTSCATGNGGEAEDYTINIIQPVNAEMNIKGNNISIANGFNAPDGLNNTLFGSTNVGSAGPIKNFFVENIGATTLDLTGTPIVEIIGAHPGDFIVNQQAAASVTSTSNSEFIIQFFPTADGTRTATVRIENTDSDEDPYEFDIEGTAVCNTVLTSSIWPFEGPKNTEVTITSVNDLTGATALINDLAMTIVSTNPTELIVLIPAGATSGNLEVLFTTGCSSTNTFTVIDNIIGGCETATSSTIPSDLFISEISDASTGSSSLVEIFNGTAGTINLATYSIRVFNNGSASASTTANLVGSLAPGELHVISIGTTSCDLSATGLASGLPDQSFDSAGSINFDNNSSDMMQLFSGGTAIDAFGVAGSSTWANGLGINGDGVNYRRQNTTTVLPSTAFDIAEWNEIDWATCGDSDYSNFGLYDFSRGIPPTVSILSAASFSCASSTFMAVTATEGISSGPGLTYQWYYLAPNATTFVVVPDTADFNDVTTSGLEIVNSITYNEYQFYCQVRENTISCYTASNAVKLGADAAVWNGILWSSPPTIDKIAIINDNYDTNIGTNGQSSFEACQLIVNSGATLTVHNGNYVEVINDVSVNGTTAMDFGELIINSKGAFIQRGDDGLGGLFTLNGTGKSQVNKRTAPLINWYDYTYWSSPVVDAEVSNALFQSNPNNRFWYNASNYLDSNGDDIDDNNNDWILVDTSNPTYNTMTPGRGYAATHNTIGFVNGNTGYIYNFEGALQTGNVSYLIDFNAANSDHWNLVGNPYPSAINVDDLFTMNTSIKNVVYLWSHHTAPSDANPGNQVLNFDQNDYILFNNAMPIGNGSDINGDGVVDGADVPEKYIPSGQSFFVSSTSSSPIIFKNSLRATGENSNTQFFRTTENDSESSIVDNNKLWINLSSDTGAYGQTGIAYMNDASDGFDGIGYDTKRNLTVNTAASIYTLITEMPDLKFGIQAKAANSLSLKEVIPLGFKTQLTEPSIYSLNLLKVAGAFMNSNVTYLKDNLLNVTHNLNESGYLFTSETGEFNNRFEIVFQPEILSISENILTPNDVSVVELSNGDVNISVGKNKTINTVDILDSSGRTIYKLKGQDSSETYNLSQLSQTTYIARITLSNGQVISKKSVKRF
jgi:hypothetical protein